MRTAIVLLLVSAALAGCSTPDEVTEEPAPTGTEAPSPVANATKNRPPVAVAVASNLTLDVGEPLRLQLNATDPDGDNLTWLLDLGEPGAVLSGSTLPAEVNHTYAGPGAYNVTFTVTDGKANASKQWLVSVLEAGPPPMPEDLLFSGSFGVADRGSSAVLEFELLEAGPSKITITMDYNEEAAGVPEVDNDLDWSVAGPGGQSGSGVTYGKEDPISINDPKPGMWEITLEAYSVFPTGLDWTVTVEWS